MYEYLIKVVVNGVTVIQKMYADSVENEKKSLDFYLKDVIIASYNTEYVMQVIWMDHESRKTEILFSK
jgi:hypothetical protein